MWVPTALWCPQQDWCNQDTCSCPQLFCPQAEKLFATRGGMWRDKLIRTGWERGVQGTSIQQASPDHLLCIGPGVTPGGGVITPGHQGAKRNSHQPQITHFWAGLSFLGNCSRGSPNVCAQLLSCVRVFSTWWTVARQAPLPMGVFQTRMWEWVAFSSSRGSFQPRNWTHFSCLLLPWHADSLPLSHLGSSILQMHFGTLVNHLMDEWVKGVSQSMVNLFFKKTFNFDLGYS